MSIAVSAVVRPSRLLLFLVGSMCFMVVCSAFAIGFGMVGNLSNTSRILVAGLSMAAAFRGFLQTFGARKAFRIDISGVGQIRLGEYNELAVSSMKPVRLSAGEDGQVVQLMADSTIWPDFMLLRLQASSQQTIILPILRDCMTEDGFRSLAVACRWIAAHNIRAEGTTTIA